MVLLLSQVAKRSPGSVTEKTSFGLLRNRSATKMAFTEIKPVLGSVTEKIVRKNCGLGF